MGEAYLGYYVTYVPLHFVRLMRACDEALHHFLRLHYRPPLSR